MFLVWFFVKLCVCVFVAVIVRVCACACLRPCLCVHVCVSCTCLCVVYMFVCRAIIVQSTHIQLKWMYTYMSVNMQICLYIYAHMSACLIRMIHWGVSRRVAWHDSVICCETTRSHVWNDSSICGIRFIHLLSGMTHAHIWHDSHIHIWHDSHIHIWHDSSIWATRITPLTDFVDTLQHTLWHKRRVKRW